ncbi:MAG: mercuric reductase [Myxococcales bacterium]|nr:mercuric reductase [Myxococcales bacterium]
MSAPAGEGARRDALDPAAAGDASGRGGGSAQTLVTPDDAHNRALVANVHPPGRPNPTPDGRYNLVVVGAGTAGLVAAMGAAGLGAKVALVERALTGGDCLNHGCVPSKALLRSAHAAHEARVAWETGAYGVRLAAAPRVDFGEVMAQMRRLRAEISANDSVARLEAAGVDVYLGHGAFVGADALEVDGRRLRFRRAVLATGARAAVPPIPGLAESGYLTNETLFSLTELPRRLVIIGAGPIGCEMAQAFRRFGSEVVVVSLDAQVLPHDDPDAAARVKARLEREGVRLRLGADVTEVARRGDDTIVRFDRGGGAEQVQGDALLLAVGRTPNVDGLGLDAAGVEVDRTGVVVDDRLRTANRRIYASGDVASAYKFTHAADAMSRLVLQNALFFGRKRASALCIPWCTFTDPAVAHVGLQAREAAERGVEIGTYTVGLDEVDRAILDGETEGFARIHVHARSGRIVGATLVARHAGDMMGEVVLAMTEGLRVGALSTAIAPYPTEGEVWKKLGDAHQRSRLGPRLAAFLRRYFGWVR